MPPNKLIGTKISSSHELKYFAACQFGDGGFYSIDDAARAVCSCGWESAASQDKPALVMLWEIHQRNMKEEETQP